LNVARVRTLFAPSHVASAERPPNVYEKGGLRIDFDSYEIFVDGRAVHLSLRDFEFLRFFVRSANRVFTREQILESVWGGGIHVDARTVDVHIRRLRARLERNASHPQLIVTVRGVGYRFDDRTLGSK
jgi:two-component system, OmpR family, response regulator RegX3